MRRRVVVTVPLIGLVALALADARPALAEADSEYVREGVSISAAGVYAIQNTSGRWRDKDDTGGAHLRFDNRISPGVSLGLFAEWLGWQGRDAVSTGITVKVFPVEMFDMSLLGGILQPYFIGTAGAVFVEDRDDGDMSAGGNFRGGGGFDLYVTESLYTYGEVHYSGAGGDPSGLESTNFLAGVGWRF